MGRAITRIPQNRPAVFRREPKSAAGQLQGREKSMIIAFDGKRHKQQASRIRGEANAAESRLHAGRFFPASVSPIFSDSDGPMKNFAKITKGTKFLSGWKEIANYLGKGVRTVQRYERQWGFPVRRPAGKWHAAVIATEAEVDAWVAASQIRYEFRLSRAQDPLKISVDALKKNVANLASLRHETTALRAELTTSLNNLEKSIQGIRGEVENRVAEGHRPRFITDRTQ